MQYSSSSHFKSYSSYVLIAVMRRSVVCLEMGICKTTLCNAALFASKTLSTSSKFALINSPYRRFARAIFQAIKKLASGTLLA